MNDKREIYDFIGDNIQSIISEEDSTKDVYKYISFYIDDELLGIHILSVQEIKQVPDITFVPNAPESIRGVINLRGKVIPVISLRSKLSLPEKEYDSDTRIIIVTTEDGNEVGVIVDKISIATEISEEQVDPPPETNTKISINFLKGVAKLGDNKLLVMLELNHVLDINKNHQK